MVRGVEINMWGAIMDGAMLIPFDWQNESILELQSDKYNSYTRDRDILSRVYLSKDVCKEGCKKVHKIKDLTLANIRRQSMSSVWNFFMSESENRKVFVVLVFVILGLFISNLSYGVIYIGGVVDLQKIGND
ncbi:MAG: hypothetical protein QXS68_07295, partial [Candidatus Methanomethylicaceae archaeon]